MIKNLKDKSQDNVMAVIVVFVMVFALSFQYYFSKFISPETPLMNIGGIAFQHIEFVSILFTVAMLIGVIVSQFLLKEKIFKLVPICIALLGFIAIFIGMFTVDFFQKLAPTMRISHVIMTASRLNGIILSASGLFIGFLLSAAMSHTKRIIHALVLALLLTVFAYSLNAFSTVYIVLGVAIVILAIVFGYIGVKNNCIKLPSENTILSVKILDKISPVIKGGIISYFFVYGYYYFINTLGLSPIVFAVTAITAGMIWLLFSNITIHKYAKIVCVLIVISLFIANACVPTISLLLVSIAFGATLLGLCNKKDGKEKYSTICGCAGAIIFAIIAMVVNHNMAEITKFSSNRIVYEPSVYGFFILLGMILICVIIDYLRLLINTKLELTQLSAEKDN